MKLSKRLQQIADLVSPEYNHIWDCCCDHGLLGTALLARGAAEHIHFVDIRPPLVSAVAARLQRFQPQEPLSSHPHTWHTHCMDVAALPLDRYQGRQLIIIAGVGGDLTTRFVQALHEAHSSVALDFLLCPVHQEFTLRQQLIASGFGLKAERLMRDNGRFYEILLVSSRPHAAAEFQTISPAGSDIWHANTPEQAVIAQEYLAKTLRHYQKIQYGKRDDVRHILNTYRRVCITTEP